MQSENTIKNLIIPQMPGSGQRISLSKEARIVRTDVSEVQIYLNGGIIKRTGRVSLQKGENEIYITGFPKAYSGETPRLSFDVEVTMESVQFLPYTPIDKDTEKNTDPLTDQKQDEFAALKQEIKNKQLQRTMLINSADHIYSMNGISLTEVSEYLEKLPLKIGTIDREISDLQKKLSDIQKKYGEQEEIKNKETEEHEYPCLKTILRSEAETEARFVIEYYDYHMRWHPFYSIFAEEEKETISVFMKGRIRQNTGENWTNINITLSTSQPSRFYDKPKMRPISLFFRNANRFNLSENTLHPFFEASAAPSLNYSEIDKTVASSNMDFDADEAMSFTVGANPPSYASPALTTPEIQENDFITDFILPGKWVIPAGEAETISDIQQFEIPVNFTCNVFPSYRAEALLQAKIPDNQHFRMLSGEADIYLNKAYVGKINIKPSEWQENAEIPFGRDQQIRVTRELVKKDHAVSRLSGYEKTIFEYEYTMTNHRKSAVEILIMDQIPVSSEKDITVEALELSSASLEKETGFLTWKKNLPAEATQKISLKYQITSPRGKLVNERLL